MPLTDKFLISAFLGVRAGSTRCAGKNYREFNIHTKDSLLEIKIQQLSKISELHQIVISSNCDECLKQASRFREIDERIKVIKRPEYLGQINTPVEVFIKHVGEYISEDNILWVHATSPFVDHNRMKEAIDFYKQNNGKSIFSANKIQNFLWDPSKRRIINTKSDDNILTNTQDLAPIFETTHAFYLNKRKTLLKGIRLTKDAIPFECNYIENIDIDSEEDFQIAQQINNISNCDY